MTLSERLSFGEDRLNGWWVLALAGLAYAVGVAARFLWLDGVGIEPAMLLDGELLLTSSDGYYYGAGARAVLEGVGADNGRIPGVWDNALVAIAAALKHLTDVRLDSVMTHLPPLAASLVALPIVACGRALGSTLWGGCAAMVGVVGFSYFNRTLPGYFDTDIFAVTLDFAVIALCIAALEARPDASAPADSQQPAPARRFHVFSVAAGLLIMVIPWFHAGSHMIMVLEAATLAAYVVLFARRDRLAWTLLLITFVALVPVWWPARVVALCLIGWLISWVKPRLWVVAVAGVAALLALILTGTFSALWEVVVSGKVYDSGPVFQDVFPTIFELSAQSLSEVAVRVAGSVPMSLLAVVGWSFLVWRRRVFLLTAPLVLLGVVMPHFLGGRFTIYAAPVVAMSLTWLAFVLARNAVRSRLWRLFVALGLSGGVLAATLLYASQQPLATVVERAEVETMKALDAIADPGDYAITWWDYGYPLWYFAGVRTLVDGSKQGHDLFTVSEIMFTDSQTEASALSRLAAERHARQRNPASPTIDRLLREFARRRGIKSDDFLATLRDPAFRPPGKKREVYVYLPWKMLRLATVAVRFRHVEGLDQFEGVRPPSLFLDAGNVTTNKPRLALSRGFVLDARTGIVSRSGPAGDPSSYKLASFTRLKVDTGRLTRQTRRYHADGTLYAVWSADERALIVVDEELYRSFAFQALVLDAHDDAYFELVHRDAQAAIYRVR